MLAFAHVLYLPLTYRWQAKVYAEVKELFKDAPDLSSAFCDFFPGASGAQDVDSLGVQGSSTGGGSKFHSPQPGVQPYRVDVIPRSYSSPPPFPKDTVPIIERKSEGLCGASLSTSLLLR